MRVKINKGDDYFTVMINDRPVPCDGIAVEVGEAPGEGIVHLFSKNLKLDFVAEDNQVMVNPVAPDPRPIIAELVRRLPAGVVEAAAMDELGMGESSLVKNALNVVADLIVGMDLDQEEEEDGHGESEHEGCDEDSGLLDEGQDFDLASGGRGFLQ